MLRLGLILISIILAQHQAVASDDYLTDSQQQCDSLKDLYSCGKYRVLRYISTVSDSTVTETNATKAVPVRLVRIAEPDESLALFPQASRSFPGASELTQFLGFVQSRMDRYLRKQGIAVPLPRGVFIAGEEDTSVGEARKKKKEIIIPLLILFTVFKVKVLVALVLIGIFFIKKVILLSALVLPSILHNLKMSCKHLAPAHGHHVEDYHDDSYAGYYSNAGGYGKDWERRYRAAKAGSVVQMQ